MVQQETFMFGSSSVQAHALFVNVQAEADQVRWDEGWGGDGCCCGDDDGDDEDDDDDDDDGVGDSDGVQLSTAVPLTPFLPGNAAWS
jgi:hypothetical protein